MGASDSRAGSHGQGREPVLEPLLARLRYRRSLRVLRELAGEGRELAGIDLGCGFHGAFLKAANAVPGVRFLGGDFRVAAGREDLFEVDLEAPEGTALPVVPDVITMHAVLEHLVDPTRVVRWAHEVLAPGGVFLATVPSKAAQPVLEFLAYRLGVVSEEEIRDHKRYFDRASLLELLRDPGGPFPEVEHAYFQLGMNNWVVARKPG